MPKTEISWKRRLEDGTRCEVKALLTNNQWEFRIRGGRFDRWEAHPDPPLEDLLELHDNLERRVGRGKFRPEVLQRLQNHIRDHYPDAEL